MRGLKLYLLLSLFGFNLVFAGSFTSPKKQTHLIELYSSEGCSSCPPADRWLAALMKRPGLWKNFVPLEFHVDYWNRLGWHDPFSQKQFTSRQRKLAASWNADTIYTPGFALNGLEWRVRTGFPAKPKNVGVLSVETNKENYKIVFNPEDKTSKDLRLHAALLAHGLKTKVLAGENKGETLEHEFVVLQIKSTQLKRQGKKYIGDLPAWDLSKVKTKATRFSLAVWLTPKNSLKPIQATGGFLN